MEKIFFIKDNTEDKISFYHLLFFLLCLPFDRFYSEVILISFIFHSLVFLTSAKLKNINAQTIFLQSMFIVSCLGALYSVSYNDALNVITKQMAILIFPVLLSVISLDLVKYRHQLLMIFSLCCSITIAGLFLDALRVIMYNKISLASIFSTAFVNHNFSLPIQMHATYLSMLLAVAFIFLLNQLIKKPAIKQQLPYVSCLVILLAGLIQLGSKSVIIALALIINIGFPWLVLPRKLRSRFLLVSIPIFLTLFLLTFSVDSYRNRFMTTLKNDLYETAAVPGRNPRIERWNTAVDLIRKSPIAGTGTGSEIRLLREMYFERKMYVEYLNALNVHNQYLSLLINNGLIGLLVYIATLFRGYLLSVKRKDIMLFTFMTVTTVVSFSENLLDVNKGIFFYAFFFSFFVYSRSDLDINNILSGRRVNQRRFNHKKREAIPILKS